MVADIDSQSVYVCASGSLLCLYAISTVSRGSHPVPKRHQPVITPEQPPAGRRWHIGRRCQQRGLTPEEGLRYLRWRVNRNVVIDDNVRELGLPATVNTPGGLA